MSRGIKRKIKVGIIPEPSFAGTTGATASYVIPVTEFEDPESPEFVRDQAMLGSTWETDNARLATNQAEPSFKAKMDEDLLPLFLKQKFTIVSSAVGGETAVFEHVASYSANNIGGSGQSFALLVEDPDHTDYKLKGFRYGDLGLEFSVKDFIYMNLKGLSQTRSDESVTVGVAGVPRDFVGRNAIFKYAEKGESVVSSKAHNAKLDLSFGLSDDEDNFVLGSGEIDELMTKADSGKIEVVLPYADETLYDLYKARTHIAVELFIEDTDRYVEGSVASTHPSVKIELADCIIVKWDKDGGANDVTKQKLTLEIVDDPAVADCPIKITTVNAVASY